MPPDSQPQQTRMPRSESPSWAGRTHMLNATYIWYSSIASTNCPHESKSVAFLKLACHFCTVLWTSDILAGRLLAALSGQHSRGGGSSTRLRRRRRRRRRYSGVVDPAIRYPESRSDTPVRIPCWVPARCVLRMCVQIGHLWHWATATPLGQNTCLTVLKIR